MGLSDLKLCGNPKQLFRDWNQYDGMDWLIWLISIWSIWRIWLIQIIGFGLIIDGVGSIIKYWGQTRIEHLVRVLRACAGFILILIA